MPPTVSDILGATNGSAFRANRHAKGNTAIVERDSKVTVIPRIIDITIQHDVSGKPSIATVACRTPQVHAWFGLEPELYGEVRGTNVDWAGRVVNRYLDAIDVVGCMAKEAQRIGETDCDGGSRCLRCWSKFEFFFNRVRFIKEFAVCLDEREIHGVRLGRRLFHHLTRDLDVGCLRVLGIRWRRDIR